jgi:long-subunit fatty acid transport protein
MPSVAFAAGIERAAPSTRVLFEEGRYLELSFSSVTPDLTGNGGDATPLGGPPAAAPNGTGDLLETYSQFGAAYKADLNDQLSYAFILDSPHGVDTAYPLVAGSIYSGTTATLDSIQLTGILAYDVSDRVKVYGGLRAQAIEAEAGLPFIGAAAGGYTVEAERDWSAGYMVGAAYQVPDIALRVALTYYSEIDHELETTEVIPLLTTLNDSVEITTPQSVNLEFQSGIAEDTLLFGSIRWVDWSEFAISPTLFSSPTVVGQPLVDYQEDWTTYTLGVGRRFSEQWSGAVQVSHEPAADYVPLTTLGPVDGRTSIGVAATYTMDNVKMTGGITYVSLGDTQNFASTDFDGGDAIGIGFRIGYSF